MSFLGLPLSSSDGFSRRTSATPMPACFFQRETGGLRHPHPPADLLRRRAAIRLGEVRLVERAFGPAEVVALLDDHTRQQAA